MSGPAANGARQLNKLDAARLKKLEACVRAHGQADVLAAVEAVGASKFCCGGGLGGWRAGVDWLLKPENCLRMIEEGSDLEKPGATKWTKEQKARYLVQLSEEGELRSTAQINASLLPNGSPRSVMDLSG